MSDLIYIGIGVLTQISPFNPIALIMACTDILVIWGKWSTIRVFYGDVVAGITCWVVSSILARKAKNRGTDIIDLVINIFLMLIVGNVSWSLYYMIDILDEDYTLMVSLCEAISGLQVYNLLYLLVIIALILMFPMDRKRNKTDKKIKDILFWVFVAMGVVVSIAYGIQIANSIMITQVRKN